jgi:hypothetical protein
MYLLNLLFDPADPSGRFAKCRCTDPLSQSGVWLQLEGSDPANHRAFDPEARDVVWKTIGGDGELLIRRGTGSPPFVAVRIAPVSAPESRPVLRAVVTFGREPRAAQHFASPFTMDNTPTGPVCAVFDFADSTLPSGRVGWYFPLKPIALAPSVASCVDRYEFTVGAIYQDGQSTYGLDPQMDVTL